MSTLDPAARLAAAQTVAGALRVDAMRPGTARLAKALEDPIVTDARVTLVVRKPAELLQDMRQE